MPAAGKNLVSPKCQQDHVVSAALDVAETATIMELRLPSPRLTKLLDQASIYAGKPENRDPHLLFI
jgi:hypothetical protein